MNSGATAKQFEEQLRVWQLELTPEVIEKVAKLFPGGPSILENFLINEDFSKKFDLAAKNWPQVKNCFEKLLEIYRGVKTKLPSAEQRYHELVAAEKLPLNFAQLQSLTEILFPGFNIDEFRPTPEKRFVFLVGKHSEANSLEK